MLTLFCISNSTAVGENGIGGTDQELLRTLAKKYNFRIEFNVAKNGFVEAIEMVWF